MSSGLVGGSYLAFISGIDEPMKDMFHALLVLKKPLEIPSLAAIGGNQ